MFFNSILTQNAIDETAQLARGFPKVQQITCITIHMNMYGDTGDLLHFWEAARELGSLVIE